MVCVENMQDVPLGKADEEAAHQDGHQIMNPLEPIEYPSSGFQTPTRPQPAVIRGGNSLPTRYHVVELVDDNGQTILSEQTRVMWPPSPPLSPPREPSAPVVDAAEFLSAPNQNQGTKAGSRNGTGAPGKGTGRNIICGGICRKGSKLRGGASGNCVEEPCGCLWYWLRQICFCCC